MEEQLTFRLPGVIKAKQDDYEDFVGPIDLILYLLSKNKIEIKDIPICELVDQYIEYLDRMERMDLEIASDFTAMAAHLIYIKTRMLLSIDDEEANQEMELLMKTLEQHRQSESMAKLREICALLDRKQEFGRDIALRLPEPSGGKREYRHLPSELVEALAGLTDREKRRLPPPVTAFAGIVGHEVYPVSLKISDILGRLVKGTILRLNTLLRDSASRSEAVATFLAVLEMGKNRTIKIADSPDGDYNLTKE